MKIVFRKSKGNPIIGITGSLNFTSHEIYLYSRKKRRHSPLLIICIDKPSYYFLGYGKKKPCNLIRFRLEKKNVGFIIEEWEKVTKIEKYEYTLMIFITNEWLYNYLL